MNKAFYSAGGPEKARNATLSSPTVYCSNGTILPASFRMWCVFNPKTALYHSNYSHLHCSFVTKVCRGLSPLPCTATLPRQSSSSSRLAHAAEPRFQLWNHGDSKRRNFIQSCHCKTSRIFGITGSYLITNWSVDMTGGRKTRQVGKVKAYPNYMNDVVGIVGSVITDVISI